jgi:hypothetical protein
MRESTTIGTGRRRVRAAARARIWATSARDRPDPSFDSGVGAIDDHERAAGSLPHRIVHEIGRAIDPHELLLREWIRRRVRV